MSKQSKSLFTSNIGRVKVIFDEYRKRSPQKDPESELRETSGFDEFIPKEMRTRVTTELETYLAEPIITAPPRDKNKSPKRHEILEFWKNNQYRFPTLAAMAKDFFCIQGTSTPSERLFSRAGNTITVKRNRLSNSTASALLCLQSWLSIPELNIPEKDIAPNPETINVIDENNSHNTSDTSIVDISVDDDE
jgi:hypothetical protein